MTAKVDTHPEGGDALAAPFMGSAVTRFSAAFAHIFALYCWWAGALYRMHRRKRHRAIERRMLGRA
jgi:hypothetical protein